MEWIVEKEYENLYYIDEFRKGTVMSDKYEEPLVFLNRMHQMAHEPIPEGVRAFLLEDIRRLISLASFKEGERQGLLRREQDHLKKEQ
jgi:hypothetical protein